MSMAAVIASPSTIMDPITLCSASKELGITRATVVCCNSSILYIQSRLLFFRNMYTHGRGHFRMKFKFNFERTKRF